MRTYFEHWERRSNALDPADVQRYGQEEKHSSGREGGGFKNYVRIAHRLFPPEAFGTARQVRPRSRGRAAAAQAARRGGGVARHERHLVGTTEVCASVNGWGTSP